MTGRRWAGEGPVLADTSAWTSALRITEAQPLLQGALERREILWCWPVRHELLYAASNQHAMTARDRILDGLREVPVDRSLQRAVLALMRELAESGSHGAHRYPLTDLTVAVAAQSAGVAILHHDEHLDRLADYLGVPAFWL